MLDQLKHSWDALDRRRQAMLVALALIMVAGLVAVGTWATRPAWAVLYSDLSPADAQAVVEQLSERAVPYRLAAGGTTVRVPQERLYELRLALAAEGLPGTSPVGFELFDRTGLSTSDLQNNVNLQRALQGELERSITTLEEITSARVHLALPPERLFSAESQPPSASVVVGLGSARLSPAQVGAITQLVASAVPGLEPQAVTVVDTAGRVLSGGRDDSGGLLTMAQIEATRAYEESLRAHLQSMLDSVVGAHKSVVRVQAALDFQSRETTRETLDPPDGEGALRREQITEEQYSGGAGAGEVGGPAGLTGAVGLTPAGERGTYEHRQQSREYEHARTQEHTTSPPGRLQRLTVAVVIDQSLGSPVAGQVRELVTAAAGIDPERGDVVTVEAMQIEAIKVAEEEAKLAEAEQARRDREQSWRRGARYASLVLMLALVGAAMMMLSRQLRALQPPEAASDDSAQHPAEPAPASGRSEAAAVADTLEFAPMDLELLRATPAETESDDEQLVARLAELGARSPEDFARRLRGWIRPTSPENGGAEGS